MRGYLKKIFARYSNPWLFWLLSWAIVALGQPSRSVVLSCLASLGGYALFWMTLERFPRKKTRFWWGCFWFTCVQAIQLSWMTATAYHGVYILWVYLALILWLGMQFGLLTAFLPRDLKLSWVSTVSLASIWTLLEWSRLFVFCGFPFNMSGIALSAILLPAQLAAFIGTLGLSFCVMLLNLLLFRWLKERNMKHFRAYAGMILLLYGVGGLHFLYHDYHSKKDSSFYHVALVQTGLRPEEKIPLPSKKEAFLSPFDQWIRILLDLKSTQASHFDLIVLPEAALPCGATWAVYPTEDVREVLKTLWGESYETYCPVLQQEESAVTNAFWAQAVANYYDSELIIGLDDRDEEKEENYNAAFHFFSHASSMHRYEKCILVPLAEYLPLKWLYPLVSRYGIVEFSTHGEGPKIFGDKISTAISICYEECFGGFMRHGRAKGAQLFVNITNDGWYLPSELPKQHFYHSRLRTIENGIPLVRACNTGITAAVDSLGRVRAKLPHGEEKKLFHGVLTTTLPLYHYPTLYTRYGDYPLLTLCGVSVIFFLYYRRRILKRLTTSHHYG